MKYLVLTISLVFSFQAMASGTETDTFKPPFSIDKMGKMERPHVFITADNSKRLRIANCAGVTTAATADQIPAIMTDSYNNNKKLEMTYSANESKAGTYCLVSVQYAE